MKYRHNKYQTVEDIKAALDSKDENDPELPNLREFYYNNYYSTATTSEQIKMVSKILDMIVSKTLVTAKTIKKNELEYLIEELQKFKDLNNSVKSDNTFIEQKLEELSEIDDFSSLEYDRIESKIINKLGLRKEKIGNLQIKSDFFDEKLKEIYNLPTPLQPNEIIDKIKELPHLDIEIGGSKYKLVNLVPHPIFFFEKDKTREGLKRNKIPDGYTIGFLKKSGAYIRTSSPMKRLSKFLNVPYQVKEPLPKSSSDIKIYRMPIKGELFLYFSDPYVSRSILDYNSYGEFPPNETIDDELTEYLFYTSKLTNCAKVDTTDHFIVINKSAPLMKTLEKICNLEPKETQEVCITAFNKIISRSGLEKKEYDKAKLIKSFIYADGICDCIVKCDQPMQEPMTTLQTRKKLIEQDEGIYD